MHFLEKFYNNILKYELINKFNYNSINKFPKLKKIILNFGCKTADIKQLASCLLALELITSQKGTFTKTKYSKILFKIRKGNPTGCKVTLNKFNKLKFLELLIIEIFPKLKNFSGLNSKKFKMNHFSYELQNTFSFSELENNYYLFNNIPKLDISFVFSNFTKKEELYFILKCHQLPFKR